MFNHFEAVSRKNKCERESRHLETLAFLIGKTDESNVIEISGLLYPDQIGHPMSVDSKNTFNNEELPEEIESKFGKDKKMVGWIHTHVRGVNCFFSSIDVHSQFHYQQTFKGFIGIVCQLTEDNFFIDRDFFKLTNQGIDNVKKCIAKHGNNNQQHNDCHKLPGELYKSVKNDVILNNLPIITYLSKQFGVSNWNPSNYKKDDKLCDYEKQRLQNISDREKKYPSKEMSHKAEYKKQKTEEKIHEKKSKKKK